MTLTNEQIDNFITELENFAPVLARSEIGQANWPPALFEDYAEKGNLLELLITINVALLREIKALTPQTGSLQPENNVTSNRSGTYFLNATPETDRQIWFNPTLNQTSGWLLFGERNP